MSDFREYLQKQLDTDPEFREWWEMREQMKRELQLADLLEGIANLQNRIQAELIPVAAHDLLNYPYTPPEGSDSRKVKALAACYELQEYIAGMLVNETGEKEAYGNKNMLCRQRECVGAVPMNERGKKAPAGPGKGVVGRPRVEFDEEKFAELYKQWKAGQIKAVEFMKEIGLTKNTFYLRVKDFEEAIKR